MTRELPSAEWRSFLESFTRQHDGWLVTVESVRGGDREVKARGQPLEGVTARSPREIVITAGDTTEVVTDARRLRVESVDGVDSAIEIEQGDGTVTRVAFRTAIAPELVDGIA